MFNPFIWWFRRRLVNEAISVSKRQARIEMWLQKFGVISPRS